MTINEENTMKAYAIYRPGDGAVQRSFPHPIYDVFPTREAAQHWMDTVDRASYWMDGSEWIGEVPQREAEYFYKHRRVSVTDKERYAVIRLCDDGYLPCRYMLKWMGLFETAREAEQWVNERGILRSDYLVRVPNIPVKSNNA